MLCSDISGSTLNLPWTRHSLGVAVKVDAQDSSPCILAGGSKTSTCNDASERGIDDEIIGRRPHPPGYSAVPRTTASCAGSNRRQPRLQACPRPFPSTPARTAD